MGTGLLVKAVTLGDPGQVGQRLCNSVTAGTAWDQLAASLPRPPSPLLGIWCAAPKRKPFPEVLVAACCGVRHEFAAATPSDTDGLRGRW